MRHSQRLVELYREGGYTGSVVDLSKRFLKEEGFNKQINNAFYEWLGERGYTGQYSERWKQWDDDDFPHLFGRAGGKMPYMYASFLGEGYNIGGEKNEFDDMFGFSRSSTATYVDSTGTLQTAAINEARTGHHIFDGGRFESI